jgi:single stranded DNA-binding protein
MNTLTIIGFVGGNAEVITLMQPDGSTVTTFSVATKEVRGTGEARKEYTTWHKLTAFGGMQKFAATIEKGDLVAVSGPIYTQTFEGKSGKVETYAVRAHHLEMLKRKNARPSGTSGEVAAEMVENASTKTTGKPSRLLAITKVDVGEPHPVLQRPTA